MLPGASAGGSRFSSVCGIPVVWGFDMVFRWVLVGAKGKVELY